MTNHAKWAVLGIILCSFIGSLGVNMMSVAMDLLQTQFGEEPEIISLVSSSYFIAQIVAMPAVPLLVRRYGLVPVTYLGISVFSLASLLCAASWNVIALALFRGMQGFAGGLFVPMVYLYIKTFVPQEKQPIYLSYFSISSSIAIILGPTLVAALPEGSGLSLLFLFNLPIMALCAAMIAKTSGACGLKEEASLTLNNMLSLVVLSLCLGCLAFTLDRGRQYEWLNSSLITHAIAVTCVAFWVFVLLQYSAKKKLLDYQLLLTPRLLFVYLCSFFGGGCIYGVMFAIPLYLSSAQQYDAMLINQVLLVTAVPQLLIMPLLAWFIRQISPLLVSAFGAILFATSCIMSSNMSPDFGGEQFFLPQLLRSVAMPMFIMPLTLLSMLSVSGKEMASSAIYFGTFRLFGGSVCLSSMMSYIAHHRDGASMELQSYIPWPADMPLSTIQQQASALANIIAFNAVFQLLAVCLLGFAACLITVYAVDRLKGTHHYASANSRNPVKAASA